MTDQKLADRIVVLGVGIPSNMPHQNEIHYRLNDVGFSWRTAEQFEHDWQVAGALMEKWSVANPQCHFFMQIKSPTQAIEIILACVEALEAA